MTNRQVARMVRTVIMQHNEGYAVESIVATIARELAEASRVRRERPRRHNFMSRVFEG